MLTEPGVVAPPATALIQNWVLDVGNRGEAFAWRHHLIQAGLDPDQQRYPKPIAISTVAGTILAPIRDADLWMISNLTGWPPYRMILHHGLPFRDTSVIPDPNTQPPLLGVRAMRNAGLRVEIDFANDTVSVWTPDAVTP